MSEAGRSKTLVEQLLEDAREAHLPVSIYLVNGFQLKGEVVDFDDEAILFHHKNAHQLVMRTGVATVYPLPGAKQGGGEWWRAYASTTAGE